MLECWNINPHDRPSFKDLYDRLKTIAPNIKFQVSDQGSSSPFFLSSKSISKDRYIFLSLLLSAHHNLFVMLNQLFFPITEIGTTTTTTTTSTTTGAYYDNKDDQYNNNNNNIGVAKLETKVHYLG